MFACYKGRVSTPIRKGMGPLTASELESLGVNTLEQVIDQGWEEIFLKWIEAYPERLNLNAAVGLIAIVEGVHWQKVSVREKERARTMIENRRASLRKLGSL